MRTTCWSFALYERKNLFTRQVVYSTLAVPLLQLRGCITAPSMPWGEVADSDIRPRNEASAHRCFGGTRSNLVGFTALVLSTDEALSFERRIFRAPTMSSERRLNHKDIIASPVMGVELLIRVHSARTDWKQRALGAQNSRHVHWRDGHFFLAGNRVRNESNVKRNFYFATRQSKSNTIEWRNKQCILMPTIGYDKYS
jgi:hypothetical protein